MTGKDRNDKGLLAPAPNKGSQRRVQDLGKKRKKAKHADTEEHAREVREVIRGRDIVERTLTEAASRERRPAAFERIDMIVVRNWLRQRPLEPPISATALVAFPRMWTTRRGRYCKFNAPGAGAYGLVRARPSF